MMGCIQQQVTVQYRTDAYNRMHVSVGDPSLPASGLHVYDTNTHSE